MLGFVIPCGSWQGCVDYARDQAKEGDVWDIFSSFPKDVERCLLFPPLWTGDRPRIHLVLPEETWRGDALRLQIKEQSVDSTYLGIILLPPPHVRRHPGVFKSACQIAEIHKRPVLLHTGG